ncbi:MAG: WD40/YVTN/BNR-like repeat-containing protein, partial [Rhodanobacteraceae bacterium]
MSKRIVWLAAASLTVLVSATAGYWKYNDSKKALFFQSNENEEEEQGRPPVDGDYWAIRLAYAGDPHNLRFEPRWFLAAAEQEKKIAAGVPAGVKNYRKPAGTTLGLDPNAFTLLGPNPLAGEGFGAGNNAGRTNVVLSDPDDPTIAYLGSDGGGVWKTTNCCTASTTWTVKTDFPEISSMAIGDLTVDPNNHNVLYAGTGDLRFGSFSFGAAGVLKSTDKGESWVVLGADVF